MVEELLKKVREIGGNPMPSIMFPSQEHELTYKVKGVEGETVSFAGRAKSQEMIKDIVRAVRKMSDDYRDLGIKLHEARTNSVDPEVRAFKITVKGLPPEEQKRLKDLWLSMKREE